MTKAANERPDLYIGLVCAAGTDLTELKRQLAAQLNVVGYQYEEIKVSSLISELLNIAKPDDEYARVKSLMKGGDTIRLNSDNGDGIAAAIGDPNSYPLPNHQLPPNPRRAERDLA